MASMTRYRLSSEESRDCNDSRSFVSRADRRVLVLLSLKVLVRANRGPYICRLISVSRAKESATMRRFESHLVCEMLTFGSISARVIVMWLVSTWKSHAQTS